MIYAIGGILLIVVIVAWRLYAAGKTAERGKAAEETLDVVKDVARPATDSDVERVSKKYKRT